MLLIYSLQQLVKDKKNQTDYHLLANCIRFRPGTPFTNSQTTVFYYLIIVTIVQPNKITNKDVFSSVYSHLIIILIINCWSAPVNFALHVGFRRNGYTKIYIYINNCNKNTNGDDTYPSKLNRNVFQQNVIVIIFMSFLC